MKKEGWPLSRDEEGKVKNWEVAVFMEK